MRKLHVPSAPNHVHRKKRVQHTMPKMIFTSLVLPLILLLGGSSGNYAAQSKQKKPNATTGIFQKLIVESGSVTIALDLDRLNGISSPAQKAGVPSSGTVSDFRFAIAANSFFTILAYNDLLRGPEQGSMALVPQEGHAGVNAPGYNLPGSLSGALKQLVVEKLSSDQEFNLAVR